MKANWSRIFRTLAIITFLLSLFAMRIIEPEFSKLSNGTGTLDMRFGYAAEESYQLLEVLGPEGRSLYKSLLGLDFLFIAAFAPVLNFLLKWVIGTTLFRGKWRYLWSISYLRGFFDVVENTMIFILLLNYPMENPLLAEVSSLSTSLKFLMLGLWLSVFLSALAIRIFRRKVMNSDNIRHP